MEKLPLEGLIVLEFCQYLSGPSAGLRLADLGARVIKIESPKGDACRKLAIKNLWVDEHDSLLFHTINRNKESFVANLKDPEDLAIIHRLIAKAQVIIHNFRPGVMEKLGLGYEAVKQLNKAVIYAEISGYGSEGPWRKRPGQDLLLQAKSGLMYTSGNQDDPPVPFGLAIGDILCGAQLVQGILAGLIQVQKNGEGSKIELSLLESLLDFQFELLTTYFASDKLPKRSKSVNGHALLGAPYGLYQAKDGYLAIAMVPLQKLATVMDCQPLKAFQQADAFIKRDEIKRIVAEHIKAQHRDYWMERFRQHDLWAMPLWDWQMLANSEGYKALEMELTLDTDKDIRTTRCPIRWNGGKLQSKRPAPALGADTESIIQEFGLK